MRFISLAYIEIKNTDRLLLCLAILLLAGLPAWGKPWRGINTNGLVHRVYVNSGYITMDVGPTTSGTFPNMSTVTYQSTYKVCHPNSRIAGAGEGVAEFAGEIYYAYIAYTPASAEDTTSCVQSYSGLSVWVARFDPGATQWVSNRALGPVSMIKSGAGRGDGAATVVFNDRLYVFTDSQTYTSQDGEAWTSTYPPVYNNVDYQPLDAVPLYPPDGPSLILIVFGRPASTAAYAELLSGTWDGDPLHGLANVSTIFTATTYGRVSLIPGTLRSQTPDWGMKSHVVQLFHTATSSLGGLVRHLEFNYSYMDGIFRQEWRSEEHTYATYAQDLFVFPYFSIECTTPATQDLRQYIAVNYWKMYTGAHDKTTFLSDALVPQYNDIPLNKCGDLGGTPTDTITNDPHDPSAVEVRRHYWTLVGVILGSPPFALNEYTATADYKDFSYVLYGTDDSNTVNNDFSMSHALLLSTGLEIRAGLGPLKTKTTFDFSYKGAFQYAHGSSTTHTIQTHTTFGTPNSAYNNLGRWGWALFNGPILVTQDFDAFAYDYDPNTGVGTRLDQTLHAITQNGASLQAASFDLADPGGNNDTYPGLLEGMQPFSCSRDLNYWYRNVPYNWKQDERWDTRLGELDIGTSQFRLPPLNFVPGMGNEDSYTYQHQDYTTFGTTQEISVKAGESLSAGKINGVTVSAGVGYTGSFGFASKTTTGFGYQLAFGLKMKECNVAGPSCTNSLIVQPYWLLPKKDEAGAGAPWIPTAFKKDRPWAVAWKVLDAQPQPSPFNCNPASATMGNFGVGSAIDTSRGGTSLPPDLAWGRIVNGMGGGEGGEPYSHYVVDGGRLAWVGRGTEERIPITADDFDPAKGVSLEVQGTSWSSSDANGSWTRSGHIWMFAPHGNVQQNRVNLKLDFGAARYDLHVERADFSGTLAGVTNANLILTINQLYTFYTTLQHDIDIAWRWSQPPADAKTAHVTSFQGRYNSAGQSGKMAIAGTLPAELPVFGDLTLDVNGHPYVTRLINLDGFQQAFKNGGAIKYAKEGVIVVVDFGKRTWSATFNGKAFNELLAPRVGTIRTKISVGGFTWSKEEHPVPDYSANLRLRQ
jgi:hypothetical protein